MVSLGPNEMISTSAVVKDTASCRGDTCCSQTQNASEDQKTAEQDFELGSGQLWADIVDEWMDLTEAEHTQGLQQREM